MSLGQRLMKGLVRGSAEVQQKKFSWRGVWIEGSEKEMSLASASGRLPQHHWHGSQEQCKAEKRWM